MFDERETDSHLADLLELKRVAMGTESEAYTWPKLMQALDEKIRRRRVQLALRDNPQRARGVEYGPTVQSS